MALVGHIAGQEEVTLPLLRDDASTRRFSNTESVSITRAPRVSRRRLALVFGGARRRYLMSR